jgi:hypothetical protein
MMIHLRTGRTEGCRDRLGGLGFSEDELAVLLAEAEVPDTAETEQEEIPEPPAEPVTRPGDIRRPSAGGRSRLRTSRQKRGGFIGYCF